MGDLKAYVDEKLEMLRKDFYIRPNKKQVLHMQTLKSEIAVDNYCRKLFMKKL